MSIEDLLPASVRYDIFYEAGTRFEAAVDSQLVNAAQEGDQEAADFWRHVRIEADTDRMAVDPADSAAMKRQEKLWQMQGREWRCPWQAPVMPATTIFSRFVRPILESEAQDVSTDGAMFVGGQPGAGKTMAEARLIHNNYFLPIIGDDFRQWHAGYLSLPREDMPDVTATLAGQLTGMAVRWARTHAVPHTVEGTWRRPEVVLHEARKGRSQAMLVATPRWKSRLNILARYFFDLDKNGAARWTPPDAHDRVCDILGGNIRQILSYAHFERLYVFSGDGVRLYSGADPDAFWQAWHREFARQPTPAEREHVRALASAMEEIRARKDPANKQAQKMIGELL